MDSEKSPESEGMIGRFTDENGKVLLLEVLSDSNLLRGLEDLDELVAKSKLIEPQSAKLLG